MEVPAGRFKAICLRLMDRVARTREPIVITKRGKPVAKLVPPDEPGPAAPLFGYMAGSAEIRGDIVRMPNVEWAALSGEENALYADFVAPATHVDGVAETRRPRRRK